MSFRYSKHYTRDEARAMLPQVRRWLEEVRVKRLETAELETAIEALRCGGGDVGGPQVTEWLLKLVRIHELLMGFHKHSIEIKDLERGLIDFPAILDGNEVFLCWETKEDDILFWHALDAGYAGREPL